jgi:hypothetical protein
MVTLKSLILVVVVLGWSLDPSATNKDTRPSEDYSCQD